MESISLLLKRRRTNRPKKCHLLAVLGITTNHILLDHIHLIITKKGNTYQPLKKVSLQIFFSISKKTIQPDKENPAASIE
jgi:hypothetical protein